MEIPHPTMTVGYTVTQLGLLANRPAELIRDLADRGELPCRRVGRHLRAFDAERLEECLNILAGVPYPAPVRVPVVV